MSKNIIATYREYYYQVYVQTWCIGTVCHVVADRAVYGLGGWSLWQFVGPSSDTAWYKGPGWQEAWPQWCTGPFDTTLCSALHSVAIADSAATTVLSGCSRWCSCRTFWGSFQSPEGNRLCHALFTTVLVCLDHDSLLVMTNDQYVVLVVSAFFSWQMYSV